MCNVHFVMTVGRKTDGYDVKQLAEMMDNSSLTNPHGFGVFASDGSSMKRGKMFAKARHARLLKDFTGKDFLVGHTRYTTHGETCNKNAHPFDNERFVWVHNGVIKNFEELRKENKFDEKKMVVDSEIIGALVLKHVEKGKSVLKSIKKTAESMTGWFSIFLLDKKTGSLYYIRDGAKFTFRLLRRKEGGEYTIVGSTEVDNIKKTYKRGSKSFLGFPIGDYETVATIKPEEDKIYQITEQGIKELASFKMKSEPILSTSSSTFGVVWDSKPISSFGSFVSTYPSDESAREFQDALRKQYMDETIVVRQMDKDAGDATYFQIFSDNQKLRDEFKAVYPRSVRKKTVIIARGELRVMIGMADEPIGFG